MSVIQEREPAVIVWAFLEARRAEGERSPPTGNGPARTGATLVAEVNQNDETECPVAAALSTPSTDRPKSKSFVVIGSVVLVAIAGIAALASLWFGAEKSDSVAIKPLTINGQEFANLPKAALVVPVAAGSAQTPEAVAPLGSAVTDGNMPNHPTPPHSGNSVSQSQVVPSADAPEVLNVNGADKDGMTPLMNAALAGQEGTVVSLLEKGAKVNAKNIYGRTALMLAGQGGYVGIVQGLLDHGADPRIKGKRGETAIALAGLNNHEEVVRLLRDAECRKSKKKGCGAPPGSKN